MSESSNKFLLRMPTDLHSALKRDAKREGISMNELGVGRLTLASGAGSEGAVLGEVVRSAQAMFSDRLIGVVAIGSWARGEATTSSDIDLLVVIDNAIGLTRDLYRKWDATDVSSVGSTVDVHFTHLPDHAAPPTPVWLEAAVDGIVLFELWLKVSRALIGVRMQILERKLVRRWAHGQPYWTEVA